MLLSHRIFSANLLMHFVHFSQEKWSVSTTTTYLAGACCQHKLLGLVDSSQDFLIGKQMQDVKCHA